MRAEVEKDLRSLRDRPPEACRACIERQSEIAKLRIQAGNERDRVEQRDREIDRLRSLIRNGGPLFAVEQALLRNTSAPSQRSGNTDNNLTGKR